MAVLNSEPSGEGLGVLLSGDISVDGTPALVAVLGSDHPFLEVFEALRKGEIDKPGGIALLSCKDDIVGFAGVGAHVVDLSGTEGEVAVGGLDVNVSDKAVLALLVGVD